jgi:hypothetical protein
MFQDAFLSKFISENAKFLTQRQTQRQLNSLQRAGDDALDVEWEVVWLNALSKTGSVQHERNWGGTTNPDVHFLMDDPNLEFVADITGVSDIGIDQQYSMERLLRAFQNVFEQNGLNRSHLRLDAHGNSEQVFKGEDRARLPWMPGEYRFEQVFFKDAGFQRFIQEAKRNPNQWRQYRFPNSIDLTVTYNPHQTSAGMTHFNYRQANLIERNSTFAALMRKYDQLERSNYQGLSGVILCDAGAEVFHNFEAGFGPTFGVDQIVQHFLRDPKVKKVVGFVITAAVVPANTGRHRIPREIDGSPDYRLALKLHLSETGEKVRTELESLVQRIEDKFPEPVTHAANAREWNESRAGRNQPETEVGNPPSPP